MTKISVIMGVYNGSKKLTPAVESILNQTFTDFEFIICDDGSSDNSFAILEGFLARDDRIKLLRNPRNLSLAPTLNNCLKVAVGEYIARMDADDISHPDRFEKQVAFLDSHQEYALVGTSRNMYDNQGIWATNYAAMLTGQPQSLRSRLGTVGPRDAAAPAVNTDLP